MRKFLIALCVALMPATAWAACDVDDLEGTKWSYYTLEADVVALIGFCNVRLNQNGRMVKGDAYKCTASTGLDQGEAWIAGGGLKINKSCRVRGSILLETGQRLLFSHATLSRDRQIIIGVADYGIDGISSFQMVRR